MSVVIDPIQSVKGKVVIDAFRLINSQQLMAAPEPRQSTSNIGHLHKPSIQALIHGLNRHYYSIAINYRKNELEQNMLVNLGIKQWAVGLDLGDFTQHTIDNEKAVKVMLGLAEQYNKSVMEEETMSAQELAVRFVGKIDPKRHLEDVILKTVESNVLVCLGAMLNSVCF